MPSLEHTTEDARSRLRAKYAINPDSAETRAKRNRGSIQSAANRARQEVPGHPATSEDIMYTESEIEFMMAVRDYQQRTGNKFPTTRELLYVVFSLGYRKD